MPLPRELGRFNARVTNRLLGPIVTRLPWFAWLEHVGRRSGRTYRTPIMVFRRGSTAVVAMSDIMAIGLLHGLHDAGVEIPGEISVVGYDDIESAAHFFPPLTTVRQPIADLGAQAAEAAINHLDRGVPLPRSTQLKPELIFRQSARRLEGGS